MKILYLWDADYPWDIRVEKICKTLHTQGHEAHIACRNLNSLSPEELVDTIPIHRLKAYKNKTLNYYLSFPLFCNPFWIRHVNKIVTHSNINCIIVRDLPLSITAIVIAKLHKIPVIFDIAEDYPAMNRDIWKARKFKGLNLILRNPFLSSLVNKIALKYTDHIFVVVKESKERLLTNGIDEKKITIISNTPEIDDNLHKKASNKFDEFTFVYTGGLQLGRGVQTVIKALPEIEKIISKFKFIIIGDGYAKPALIKLAEELNVNKHIEWMGFVNHNQIYEIIAKCHVGIIPHFVTDHTNTTIPNKIFDYMYMSLPVLSSNILPIQRILSEENCGFVFNNRDENDLAAKLHDFYKNGNYFQLGENGRSAVLLKYNWGEDAKRLSTSLERISSKIVQVSIAISNKLKYRKIHCNDLIFYLQLRKEYYIFNKDKKDLSKFKQYSKFFLLKLIGFFSLLYKDIYNITIFEEIHSGRKVGFLHLSNLHLLRITGSYKSNKKIYLELYSVDPAFRKQKFGSSIIRTVQEKIYPDTRIFGIISSNNTKALLISNKTGRKVYSSVLKYKCSPENLTPAGEHSIKNIAIKNYHAGSDEYILYKIYKESTPRFIAQVEDVESEDFSVSNFDRSISIILKSINRLIERVFIVYYNDRPIIALNIKIFKKTNHCEIKLIGDTQEHTIFNYIIIDIIKRTSANTKINYIYFYAYKHQKTFLQFIKSINCLLDNEYLMVCNYENFI